MLNLDSTLPSPGRAVFFACALLWALAGTAAVAQDLESLFGSPTRDLTQVVGASTRAGQSLVQAADALAQRQIADAVALYDGLLTQGVSTGQLVQVPATRGNRDPLTRCYRRLEDVVMTRLATLPEAARANYLELSGARARILMRFYEDSGDEKSLAELANGYLLLPEGQAACFLLIDSAIEGGDPALALSLAHRWLRFGANDRPAEDVAAAEVRIAMAAELLGHGEFGKPARDSSAVEILTGGSSADAPAAHLPPSLAAALQAVRDGAPGIERQLGAPVLSIPMVASFETFRSPPSNVFLQFHPLYQALPLAEPARALNLMVTTTPTSLVVLDVDSGYQVLPLAEPARALNLLVTTTPTSLVVLDVDSGYQVIDWNYTQNRALLDSRRRDRRFLRIPVQARSGLWQALQSPADSSLYRFPLPRMQEQWLRYAPVLAMEPDPAGGERLVAYCVMGEDGVMRGSRYGGSFLKFALASRPEANGTLLPLADAELLWLAETGAYLPSGRPLLRAKPGRVAIGMVQEPKGDEATLDVVLGDFDSATGALLSRTPVTTPAPNRAWKQDELAIPLAHPVALALTGDAQVLVADQRGTIACVDPSRLRPGTPAASEETPPASGTLEWAVTYHSLHVDNDNFDSGLRGFAASGIGGLDDGRMVVAPSDSDVAFIIGPDARQASAAAAVDLELPVVTLPREEAQFFVGISGRNLILQGREARAFDADMGTGWRALPRPHDEILLRRCASADGFVFEPSQSAIRILNAQDGRLLGILHLPGLDRMSFDDEWLATMERAGVSLLGDLLVLQSERGLAAWRIDGDW